MNMSVKRHANFSGCHWTPLTRLSPTRSYTPRPRPNACSTIGGRARRHRRTRLEVTQLQQDGEPCASPRSVGWSDRGLHRVMGDRRPTAPTARSATSSAAKLEGSFGVSGSSWRRRRRTRPGRRADVHVLLTGWTGVAMPMRGGRMLCPGARCPRQPAEPPPVPGRIAEMVDNASAGSASTAWTLADLFRAASRTVPATVARPSVPGRRRRPHPQSCRRAGMNTGMQDAFNLVWKSSGRSSARSACVAGQLPAQSGIRWPRADRFTARLTRQAPSTAAAQRVRNAMVKLIPHVGAVAHEPWPGSPRNHGRTTRAAPSSRLIATWREVAAGEHLPLIWRMTMSRRVVRQLGLAVHTVTVAAGHPPRPPV